MKLRPEILILSPDDDYFLTLPHDEKYRSCRYLLHIFVFHRYHFTSVLSGGRIRRRLTAGVFDL